VNSVEFYTQKLIQDHALAEGQIVLGLKGMRIGVRSNSSVLLEKLGIYFAHTLDVGPADLELLALETDPPELDLDFIDWRRETNKSGRKDSYIDFADGRLIRKVRTGMVFVLSADHNIAAGPCLQNNNQVINFINAAYMTHLQQHNALICHASGLALYGQGLGIAGFSGGGKSTLMLHMLKEDGVQFLSNDRLFINRNGEDVIATGIPKLPRINPGTILNNDMLTAILTAERHAQLSQLPPQELWDCEEKYDVDVEAFFGEGKIATSAQLSAFLVLNWRRDSDQQCAINAVNVSERPDLLNAMMKSPGPFYQLKAGGFYKNNTPLDAKPYRDIVANVPIFEATGAVDFDHAADQCLNHLKRQDLLL